MVELYDVNLSKIITDYLKENDLTITELSRITGINKASLSRCIKNNSFLSKQNLVKLLKYTNISIMDFHEMDRDIISEVDDAINKTNDLVLSLIKQMKGEQIK